MAKIAYGADVSNIRGKVGTNVFTRSRSGPTLRIRVRGKNPKTPAQNSIRGNLTKASVTFKSLTPAQVAQWSAFAQTITKKNPTNGVSYNPTANTAFVALASKFLQINPSGALPLTPPAASFAGDTITLTAVGAAGKITFTGSGVNAANVRTELLVQRLKSANRTPTPKGYRTQQFFAFAPATLTRDVALTPGAYIPAYRFVNAQTGQEATLITLPLVQVT